MVELVGTTMKEMNEFAYHVTRPLFLPVDVSDVGKVDEDVELLTVSK